MALKEGMRVERCSNEDGYGGAWFQGLILSVSADARRCKIRYDKFVTDDGKALVEEVCLHSEVRPIPPHVQSPLHYSVGDAVEAYDTDCWWRGFIIKLFQGAEEELWMVYFPDTQTLKAYPLSDLRPAQEWLRGNWILAPKEKIPIMEQIIRSSTVGNSEETPLHSGGEGDGKKRGRGVKSMAASRGGRSGKRKKLKIEVNTRASWRQIAEESLEE